MNEGSRRLIVVIGAVAAAAGVAVASYIYFRRASRNSHEDSRDVTDILMDCYAKVREIQANLSELHPAVRPAPAKS